MASPLINRRIAEHPGDHPSASRKKQERQVGQQGGAFGEGMGGGGPGGGGKWWEGDGRGGEGRGEEGRLRILRLFRMRKMLLPKEEGGGWGGRE